MSDTISDVIRWLVFGVGIVTIAVAICLTILWSLQHALFVLGWFLLSGLVVGALICGALAGILYVAKKVLNSY